MTSSEVITDLKCYHCGQRCEDILWVQDKSFCCYGCKTVFEILNENDLCEYYNLDKNPGIQRTKVSEENFSYLDQQDIRKKVIAFDSPSFAKVRFYVPAVHCISCIWLLENLRKLNPGILKSEVNFAQKAVAIDFDPAKTNLCGVARALSLVGYPPQINLDSKGDKAARRIDKTLVLKLALAGFCFGNVMLFSFPEYLGLDHHDKGLMRIFSFLNLALSVPVFFYSAADYFRSSYKSFQQRQLNIDVPIAAGLLALFLRSTYDIITATGPGYLDSFTGLVFFLLIGRWFQSKTYESLAFDRDFTSYFPLAINRLAKDEWKPAVIYDLRRGDTIQVRNMEIIPADSTLLDNHAYIDYSFVTGESKPVKVNQADLVYAGGRLVGAPVKLVVENRVSQSHLTSLWNNGAFRKITESKYQKTIDRAARIFTWIVIGIAIVTAVYWQTYDPSEMWLVLTSVLMVACPCALALAAPFTYGSMLRIFGKNQFYLKNADVIERLANIDSIVFDKTGTITHGSTPDVTFIGALTADEYAAVKLVASCSSHPLSTIVAKSIHTKTPDPVVDFHELPGKGIQGTVGEKNIRLGSAAFIGTTPQPDTASSYVFVSVDGAVKGFFTIKVAVRQNIAQMIKRLGNKCTALLSGDSDADRPKMRNLFNPSTQLLFYQDPHDKLAYIKSLQTTGQNVLMVGDGLNDSGALKQSNVGVAVTDDTGVFTPACDGILSGQNLSILDKFLELAKTSTIILRTGFGISFFYNAIALTFAVTGNLTPLVAAILMPISSISVVGFSSLAVSFMAKKTLNSNQF
ncbi:MAG TPA: heavy metal translocating P-type ATPase metal-binding domain-containing protein [Chryseosolibacter sp.]